MHQFADDYMKHERGRKAEGNVPVSPLSLPAETCTGKGVVRSELAVEGGQALTPFGSVGVRRHVAVDHGAQDGDFRRTTGNHLYQP